MSYPHIIARSQAAEAIVIQQALLLLLLSLFHNDTDVNVGG